MVNLLKHIKASWPMLVQADCMRIVHRDLKEGIVKVKPESLDDLWYLKSVLKKGDLVSGRSYRRIRDEEKTRADKGVRVPVHLGVQVEGVEFAPYINRLRVAGKIVHGPEDLITLGTYHTIEVEPHDVISVRKGRWQRWELDRLKEAEEAAKTPVVLITAIEEGEAEFAVVRRYGIDFQARVTAHVSGKRVEKDHETSLKEFLGETAKKLGEILKKEGIETVILCGPGFTKEDLLTFLKEKHSSIAEKVHLESAGAGGRSGIKEVIKRGAVERVAEESRVSLEFGLVERIMEAIARGTGLVAYGLEEVQRALDYGAVEQLLITDTFLRKYEGADGLIERAKGMRGEVVIVSTEHEAGERLQALGGIGALLRFRIGT